MPSLQEIYDILFKTFGPQHWWPAKTKFEMVAGAILTQKTSWKNVEKALESLKRENLSDVRSIAVAETRMLENAIYSSGFFRQKAERLKEFCSHVERNYHGNIDTFLSQSQNTLEKELLSLKGIGHETADSILLYAARHPVFVVDSYTMRICKRLGVPQGERRVELRRLFEEEIEKNVELYGEYHALLVMLAKKYCKKKPVCGRCPLRQLCAYCMSSSL
jgi:endonuclease-3 related protein